jgi:hypothetical protein
MAKLKEAKPDEDNPFGPLEFVDRPVSSRGRWPIDPIIRMLEEVLPGGKQAGRAVKVPIHKIGDLNKLHMSMRYGAKKNLHAKFRYKLAGKDTLLVWAEKLAVIIFLAALVSGCSSSATYRHPQTYDVTICEKPAPTWVWGTGIFLPVAIIANLVGTPENIQNGNRYADCKNAAEAAGYERWNP